MSKGKSHDRFNLIIGAILTGLLLGLERSWPVVLVFVIGWLIATFIFSPDTDIAPKKRTTILRLFLYPYSVFFKHRGISHSILFGTLTRVMYVLWCFGILIWIFQKMGYIPITIENYGAFLWDFLINYDYSKLHYKMLTWFYLGMFLADFCHIFLDRLTHFIKKLFRFG